MFCARVERFAVNNVCIAWGTVEEIERAGHLGGPILTLRRKRVKGTRRKGREHEYGHRESCIHTRLVVHVGGPRHALISQGSFRARLQCRCVDGREGESDVEGDPRVSLISGATCARIPRRLRASTRGSSARGRIRLPIGTVNPSRCERARLGKREWGSHGGPRLPETSSPQCAHRKRFCVVSVCVVMDVKSNRGKGHKTGRRCA
jgi:hypothetical protein